MLYSKRTEELNKKYNEYLNKFNEYSEKIHLISSHLRELKQQLNNEFIYKGFNCIVKSEEIKYKSLIMQDKKDNRRLYILINSNLSIDDAINEVEYVKNNMLPRVIENILKAENEEIEREFQEKERAMQQFTFKNLKYEDIETLIRKPIITYGELIKSKKMADIIVRILQEDELTSSFTACNTVSFATMFYLGIMEGKRQERAKRRGVN